MTRKDYEAIARIVREAHEEFTDHAPIIYIQARLAAMLAADNPAFDRERFLKACQP